MTAGERVILVAKAKKIKLGDIADKLGLSPTGISLWGKEGRNIPSKYLSAVAKILDVSEGFLLNGEGEPSIYNIEEGREVRPKLRRNKEDTLGGRINIYREANDLTPEDLAAVCGIADTARIKQIEQNEVYPTPQEITRIAGALKIYESYIIDGARYRENWERATNLVNDIASGKINAQPFHSNSDALTGLFFDILNNNKIDNSTIRYIHAVNSELKTKDAQIAAMEKTIATQDELLNRYRGERPKEAVASVGATIIMGAKKETAVK